MSRFKKNAIRLALAVGLASVATPALAFYVYSWDLKYKKECHWYEDPRPDGAWGFVCGKWEYANIKAHAPGGPVRGAPGEFALKGNLESVPEKYRAQFKRELQRYVAERKAARAKAR